MMQGGRYRVNRVGHGGALLIPRALFHAAAQLAVTDILNFFVVYAEGVTLTPLGGAIDMVVTVLPADDRQFYRFVTQGQDALAQLTGMLDQLL